MPVYCECHSCGKKYKVGDDRAGTVIECRECGADIEIPEPRNQLRRRRGPNSRSSSNGLLIGLGITAVVLLGLLFSGVFRRGDNQQEIAQQAGAPFGVDNANSSPSVPGAGGNSSSAAQSVAALPHRINRSVRVDQAKLDARLAQPTPHVSTVATAAYVGANGFGLRVPAACVVDVPTDSRKALEFKVMVPGQPTGTLEIRVTRDPRYTAATPVDVVTRHGSVNIVGRGSLIIAPGGTVQRAMIDKINFWVVNMADDKGGTILQIEGYDTGLHVSMSLRSPQPENGNISQVLNAIARSFSRSATSARIPAEESDSPPPQSPSPSPSLASSPPSSQPGFMALPSSEPRRVDTSTRPTVAASTRDSGAGWGNGSKLNIPLEDWATQVFYSPAPAKFACVANTIYSLESGESLLQLPYKRIHKATFSPQGKWFAVFADGDKGEGHVVLHPLDPSGGEAVQLVLDNLPQRYETLRFLSDSKLLVHGRSSGDRTTAIWNLETFKVEKRLEIDDLDRGRCATTVNGQFLAAAGATELNVFNTQNGRQVAQMARPTKAVGLPFALCNGLAFSPDMSELAALVQGKHFLVWSNRGKIVVEHELSETLGTSMESEHAVVWLPDGSGWLLHGRLLLLRDNLTEAWRLKPKRPYDYVPGMLIDNNHVVAAMRQSSKGVLIEVEIPLNTIRAARDAFNKVPPILNEGESLTLDLKISNLRHSSEPEVRTALTEAFTNRLKRGKVGIAPGKPVVLKVTYSEKPGPQRKIVSGAFGGLPTNQPGVMVQDTECSLEVDLIAPGRTEPVSSNRITTEAGLLLKAEANEAGLRKDAFENMLLQVSLLDLPLRLSGDPNVTLPVVTELGGQ